MDSGWGNVFPYFAGAFKIIILCIGAYLAIKWHFDEDRRVKEERGEAVDTSSVAKKVTKVVVSVILFILFITFVVYATNWYYSDVPI